MARCISYSVVSSTQEVALRLAKEGAPHGTAVSAETQMLGRGRQGRSWASPKGGLYLSMVLRPDPAAFPLLSLACGMELRTLLAPHVARGTLQIKWPNDLFVASSAAGSPPRKLGGVLIDVVTRPGSEAYAVAGVGINVEECRAAFPPELQDQVVFLSEVSESPVSPAALQKPTLTALLAACARLSKAEERASVPAALAPHLLGVGKTVHVGGTQGTFQGVGPNGEARVQVAGESSPRLFEAGELDLGAA